MVVPNIPGRCSGRVVETAEAALILRTPVNGSKSGERRVQSLARSGGDASGWRSDGGAVRERAKTATHALASSLSTGGGSKQTFRRREIGRAHV